MKQPLDFQKEINRFELIDHTSMGGGRVFTKWSNYPIAIQYSLQDEGRTLKVFLRDEPTSELQSFSELAPQAQLNKKRGK